MLHLQQELIHNILPNQRLSFDQTYPKVLLSLYLNLFNRTLWTPLLKDFPNAQKLRR